MKSNKNSRSRERMVTLWIWLAVAALLVAAGLTWEALVYPD
jgi:hypothetical protein